MLTYCTNIHPAESWAETFANVRKYVPEVKEKTFPAASFPIGLRLSGRAAREIDQGERERFQEWCAAADCFVATVNGFPFGAFHHVPVKEAVYLPDWRHPERLHYTRQLADLLSFWLPAGQRGSISTVPLGFRDNIGPAEERLAGQNIRQALEFLDRLAQESGKLITLAIEPEPSCALETTPDVVVFFERLNLPASLRPYLAVCYDCCHQALQFESPVHSLKLLQDNDIRIGHVQVSSALRLEHPDIKRLDRFREPCYLHQTVARRQDGSLVRFPDLDPALAADLNDVEEWRVHFHVPVFVDRLADCASTQPFLKEILPLFDPDTPLEVETYTWTVLPPDLQTATVVESIVREIEWVKTRINKAVPPSDTKGG